ncbi:hypothetical protein Tco_1534169 [Tanacetum coccineum]
MEENKSINRSDIQKDLYNALVESYNSDKDIISSYGDVVTMKRGQDDQIEGQREGDQAKKLSHQKIQHIRSPIDDLEEHSHQEFNTGDDDVIPVWETLEDASQWNPPSSPTSDHEWHKTKTANKRPPQPWILQLTQATGIQSSFNEFFATPINFSAFVMHRLKIENLTQEVLIGLTYDLIKGTCKSVVELEYHLEEVFKATNDRLDWHNPEGNPYPHDLSKPIPLFKMNGVVKLFLGITSSTTISNI